MDGALELRWLLNQSLLNLTLLAGGEGTFHHIGSSELLDPGEFLPSNSIVLTIGVRFRQGASLTDYAARLADAGVTAIGFGTGLEFDTVPDELVDACRAHRLTLFDVPRPTPFLAVIQAVIDEKTRRARRVADQLSANQEQLNIIAREEGASALVKKLSAVLGAEVAVLRDALPASGSARDSLFIIDVPVPPTSQLRITSSRRLSETDRSLAKHCAGLLSLLQQSETLSTELRREVTADALARELGFPALDPLAAGFADDVGYVVASTTALPADVCLQVGRDRYVSVMPRLPAVSAVAGAVAVSGPVSRTQLTRQLVDTLFANLNPVRIGDPLPPPTEVLAWTADPAVQLALRDRYDRTLGTLPRELREAVGAYVQAGGQVNTAAVNLSVHRHTMRARLERAANHLGLDLAEPRVLAELTVLAATFPPAMGSYT